MVFPNRYFHARIRSRTWHVKRNYEENISIALHKAFFPHVSAICMYSSLAAVSENHRSGIKERNYTESISSSVLSCSCQLTMSRTLPRELADDQRPAQHQPDQISISVSLDVKRICMAYERKWHNCLCGEKKVQKSSCALKFNDNIEMIKYITACNLYWKNRLNLF